MILEVRDITGSETGSAHIAMPETKTLGDVFDYDERLQKVKPRIVSVSINGARVHNWETLTPKKNDIVQIIVDPGIEAAVLLIIYYVVAIIAAIVSIVATIISLTSGQPDDPKLSGSTPTYTFDGLRNTFTPGGPIPVIYGEHDTGGQVLMYYVDVVDRRTQKFYELIAVSEGEIDSVQNIKINKVHIDELGGVTSDVRLGTGSQTIISGFEIIRNTFFDGRTFSPDEKLTKQKVPISLSPIIYPTVSNDVQALDIDVIFPEGLGRPSATGGVNRVWAEYEVRYSEQGSNNFILHGTRRNAAKSRDSFIDRYHVDFPTAGAYDAKLTFTKASKRLRPGIDFFRHIVHNVTEIRGSADPYRGTALVAVQAVANAKLQGGQPTITSLVRGRKVKIYDSVNSARIAWTQNPAWCLYDYMTNSVYGMGPYVTEADIHKQSFIDFATLANSQVEGCPEDVPVVTRFYFSETQSAEVSPTISTDWTFDHINIDRRKLMDAPDSSSLTILTYIPDGVQHLGDANSHFRQYVSGNRSAQLIAGTVKAQLQCDRRPSSNNIYLALKIYVVNSGGTAVRGTLLAIQRDDVETDGPLVNRKFGTYALTPLTILAGDRLVVETGMGGSPVDLPGTQHHDGDIIFGCAASSGDLPEDDTTSAPVVPTHRPWIEFSTAIT